MTDPGGKPIRINRLAADRVYLSCMSPCTTVGSYPTRFIFSHRSR